MNALIVEDHSETRDWLIALAAEAFPGVSPEGASTLEQARSLVVKKGFKLALVDISLPDGSGIDFVREVTEQSPDTYCVMATIHDDDAHLFPALQAGAQGYLLKEQPRDKLLAQLQGIVQGEPPLSPGIARRIMQHFKREPVPAPGVQLSERESEVLALTAKGLRRGEVAQTLGISANTVAGHLKNIYRKLNISTRAEAALEASRRGLVTHGR